MIDEKQLNALVLGLGFLMMLLIVVYHFVNANASKVTAATSPDAIKIKAT